jgi:hypothetical protein
MASSVSLGYPLLLDGGTYNGQMYRVDDVSALAYNQGTGGAMATRPGVLQGATRWRVQPGSGMHITVDGGAAVIPSGVSALQGAYRVAMIALATLDVATSDPSNPRIDAVWIEVDDVGSSSSTAQVEILPGTPTPGATLVNLLGAPAAPTTGLLLAYVLVPAGSTSVTSGNISDQRTYTVSPGGIIPLPNASSPPNAQAGQYGYDAANDRLFQLVGSAQAKTLPWAPQRAANAGASCTGPQITLCTVTVAVDGSTDLEIIASCQGVNNPFFNNLQPIYSMYIDAVQVRKIIQWVPTSPFSGGGAGFTHFTASGVDRPAAGSHTVSLQYNDSVATGAHPTAVQASELYVRAAPL